MALLYMDSFDHYATADMTEKWTTSGVSGSGSVITIAASGRRSSSAFRWTTGGSAGGASTGYLHKGLTPGDTTCVVGFAVLVPSGTVGTVGMPLAAIRDGTTPQVLLRLNADYSLSVVRGAQNGTVLATSPVVLSAGLFAYVEWKVTIHNTAGTVAVRVNGVSVPALSLSSQDTQNTATTQWTAVAVGTAESVASTHAAGTRNVDWDDLYVLDGTGAAPWNTFLGDCRVDVRAPTAEGASSAWTPSTGTDNALTVDEAAPNDDTDYNAAVTTGLTDTFVVPDAPVAGATIFGVQHCLAMKKMDAGVCTVAPVIRHGGTDYVGANLSPVTSYAYGLQIAQTNPGTGAQWTEADFNAAEFGYRKTA